MFKISNEIDYSLLFLKQLKEKTNQDYLSLNEIINKTKLPKRFLARIASKLVRQKIIESREGKVGGYRLIADLSKISFQKYLSFFNNEFNLIHCLNKKNCCQYQKHCGHKKTIQKRIFPSIIKVLRGVKLSQLIT